MPLGHALPQRPQWFVLVWSAVSHPLALSPSQSPKPALQVSRHVPSAHAATDTPGPRHSTVVYPAPSALQTRRAVVDAHVAEPGVHKRASQKPLTHV
jgi:hypothetical protein